MTEEAPAGDTAAKGATAREAAPADGGPGDGETGDGETENATSGNGAASGTGEAGIPGAGGEQKAAGLGDARLRDAVAAWVATSEAERRPSEPAAQPASGSASGSGDTGASAGPGAGTPGEDVTREDVTGEDVTGEDATGEDGAGEDGAVEDAAGRADLVTAAFGGLRAARTESSERGGSARTGASTGSGEDRGTVVFGRPLPGDEESEPAEPPGQSAAAEPSGSSTGKDEDKGAEEAEAEAVDPGKEPTPEEAPRHRNQTGPLAKANAEGGDSARADEPARDTGSASPAAAGSKPGESGERGGSAGSGADADRAGGDSGAAGAPAGGAGAQGKPVDQPTAVFRVRQPGKPGDSEPAAGTGGKEAESTRDSKSAPGATGAKKTPQAAEAESAGTAGKQPEVREPGGGKPGTAKPGTAKPGTAKPGTAKPGTGASEAGAPDAGGPEPARAGAGGPEAGKETAGKSGTGKSGPGRADAGKHGPGEPGTGKPGAAGPAAGRTSTFVPLQSSETAPRTPAPSKTPASGPSWAAGPEAARADSASGAGGSVAPSPAGESEVERTKQQPLPPLDLLAQLTNTPPPPETPLRTLVRRVKIWTPLVVLLLIVFAIAQSLRPLPEPELRLTAAAEYAFKGEKPSLPWPDEGQAYVEIDGLGSLGSSGAEKPVPIASVAKVMTAYVFLREYPVKKGDEGVRMKVDARAVEEYERGRADSESVVRLTEGQMLSEYEALEALMLPSANNVARLMARWYEKENGGDFVAAMNDAAKDLGMKNTTFTDPSGLEKTTVSTAKDLVKLGKAAMAVPVFKEISAKPYYIDSNDDKQLNYNRLIPYTGIGIKTGTSTAAGGNLLFAAEQPIAGTKQLIVGAALGQYKVPAIDSVTEVSKQLIESAQAVLTDAKVVEKGQVVGHVDDGLGGTTPVVATEDVTAVGWPGLTVDLALNDGGETVPHEAEAGTEVGLLTVGSGPGQVKVPVALEKAKEEPGFGSKLTRIL
ncbi:D-alanyl-D-alanine carboxypeptidase [Streptomyces sp. F63]|uniref:D-alanyl-D-alanine carboxypeptidase n=1 Tax=Streptomyces sp. F63 TaxID=2824887 RepID=UPI001B38CDFD|nr:D-alanyl-D-alanine carboxypeptidase [Streptomyces sp. F63]MBQ0986287.1 D-alanyl-D-alanine carboxypeptidase [Streptomyces sp. F63]